MRIAVLLVPVLLAPAAVGAQAAPAALPPEIQIAAAVAPLPQDYRADATVLGYAAGREGLVPLREGTGAFICLADDPRDERFHTACYHRSLEPFMARGRELRAGGHGREALDSLRNAEAAAGALAMPQHPAALYSLTGTPDALDAATGAVSGARPLYVIYVPFATAASTGLPTRPEGALPWLMNEGAAKAHIMFTPTM
jgi:hypothetical protein